MSVRPVTVVGAAILDGFGRVLAAERADSSRIAGLWEFPGGKVEDGESDLDALIRECAEELDVIVAPGDRLGSDVPLPNGAVLRVWLARITSGTPRAQDHRTLRWLTTGELADVAWLPADEVLLDQLRRVLAS